eukprot:5771256-Prymnesium_polylepis.3
MKEGQVSVETGGIAGARRLTKFHGRAPNHGPTRPHRHRRRQKSSARIRGARHRCRRHRNSPS